MNLHEIMDKFSQQFMNVTDYRPINKFKFEPSPARGYKFDLYPIGAIKSLMDTIKPKNNHITYETADEYDRLDYYCARFVVGLDNKILFAREGNVDAHTPAHSMMRPQCIAAGNIYFNDEQKIVSISDKSGHFVPHWSCLVWPLLILNEYPDLMSDSITVNCYTEYAENTGNSKFESHIFTRDDLLILKNSCNEHGKDILPSIKESNLGDQIEVKEKLYTNHSSKKKRTEDDDEVNNIFMSNSLTFWANSPIKSGANSPRSSSPDLLSSSLNSSSLNFTSPIKKQAVNNKNNASYESPVKKQVVNNNENVSYNSPGMR